MSSGSRRDPNRNTSNQPPLDSYDQYSRLGYEPSSAVPTTAAHQAGIQQSQAPVQYSQVSQASPMALQPPLLPSIPTSFGAHRGAFGLDPSTSRVSLASQRDIRRPQSEQVTTPDTSPSYPTRRGSLQKRSFRQRRKDPSCDACRERKVKCDATESRSCTECATRGVRCQFTKDTNRRMSSIKQVQELERQITQMRHQNERLRLLLAPEHRMEVDAPEQTAPLRLSGPRPGGPQLYRHICENTRRFARGIFKPPTVRRARVTGPTTQLDLSSLPQQADGAALVENCQSSFVSQLGLIDWDLFRDSFRSIYDVRNVEQVSKPWASILMSVLSLGCLQDNYRSTTRQEKQDRAKHFISRSLEYLSLADEHVTLEHCRAALLLSIYHVEANQRSAGWTWLSVAVSFAFELGLQGVEGDLEAADMEERQQLWWPIYCWERLLCLELSQPLLVDDEDCEIVTQSVQLSPSEADEALISGAATHGMPQFNRSILPLMRLYGSLRRLLRNPVISTATLLTFESLLEPIAMSYSAPMDVSASALYDSNYFTFSILVSNASLLLNRHNFSWTCSLQQRFTALDGCVAAAQTTVRCVRDSLAHAAPGLDRDSSSTAWASWVRSAASSLTCTHLWRCILVLTFALDFESAMVCAQACDAIADSRQINIACGRHLEFYLELLKQRMRREVHQRQIMLDDLEMLAYLSADLQGDRRSSWIWQDEISETGSEMPGSAAAEASIAQDTRDFADDGDVWRRVHLAMQELEQERTRQRPLPELQQGESETTQLQGSPQMGHEGRGRGGEGAAGRASPDTGEGNKRMSIANII